MRSELSSLLLKFVQEEVCIGDLELAGDTDLLLTGAVDSLGVIRITQWLQTTTGIEVDPADVTLENFQTVDRMVAYAESQGAVI
ncbi:MAG: acyl carrier protein [Acidimicrobiia bacterium]|nr:acyl carrier protein [Acidimicrobiia bacterium]